VSGIPPSFGPNALSGQSNVVSPFISPYHCMTGDFAMRLVRVVAGAPDPGVWRREILWYFSGLRGQRRIDLGGPGG
jgi:hypothetical protein